MGLSPLFSLVSNRETCHVQDHQADTFIGIIMASAVLLAHRLEQWTPDTGI